MKRLTSPTIILTIGLLLNVGAVLIAVLWLNSSSIVIAELQNKLVMREQQINKLRELSALREQAMNTLFLLKSLNAPEQAYKTYAIYVKEWLFISQASNLSLDELILFMQQEAVVSEQRIKDMTTDRLNLDKEIVRLSHRERIFFNIAILIQILGLILVVSKDIIESKGRHVH